MLPLVNTAHIPIQTQLSLTNTTIPENNAQRVPYDNVAPLVSSPRTEPYARKNPEFLSPHSNPALPKATAASTPTEGKRLSGAPFGTPATLLAQLIGQPIPGQTSTQLRAILSEYEKLISDSQTKYMPSNATKPDAKPAGLFGQLLHQSGKPAAKTTAGRISITDQADKEEESDNKVVPLAAPAHTAPIFVASLYQASVTRNETLKAVS